MSARKIIVEKYNPQWKDDFYTIKKEIVQVVANIITTIEHVGSTSVEGLSAKPIIDIDIVISDESVLPDVIEKLASIGYLHEGDLGIKDREAFRYSGKIHLRAHHLYVCPQSSVALHQHITFRDYLRSHPEAVAEYSSVKEEAAMLFPENIEAYMQHKAPCIEKLYKACGL